MNTINNESDNSAFNPKRLEDAIAERLKKEKESRALYGEMAEFEKKKSEFTDGRFAELKKRYNDKQVALWSERRSLDRIIDLERRKESKKIDDFDEDDLVAALKRKNYDFIEEVDSSDLDDYAEEHAPDKGWVRPHHINVANDVVSFLKQKTKYEMKRLLPILLKIDCAHPTDEMILERIYEILK